MSSAAIIRGIERASAAIGAAGFGRPALARPEAAISSTEGGKLAAVVLFFAAALFLAARRFPWSRKRAILVLQVFSIVLLGFVFGAQFSLSTAAMLLGGNWTQGLATYAPALCLLLAVAVWFATGKNHFCATVCPFGGLQECVGAIGAGAILRVSPWMKWPARFLALGVLCFALYTRNPSLAAYEPFGRTFNFIGSGLLLAVSGVIILSSLGFMRPWCRLLCPVTPVFDYLNFMRSWLGPVKGKLPGRAADLPENRPATPASGCLLKEASAQKPWKNLAGVVLFVVLLGLCGAELGGLWKAALSRNNASVTAVRSVEKVF